MMLQSHLLLAMYPQPNRSKKRNAFIIVIKIIYLYCSRTCRSSPLALGTVQSQVFLGPKDSYYFENFTFLYFQNLHILKAGENQPQVLD